MGDDGDRRAATTNAQKMVPILDAAKPNQADEFGLSESQIIELYKLWLIVGSWTRENYAKYHGEGMLYPRAPKPNPGDAKDLDLVRSAIKGFVYTNEKDNNTSHRSDSFDLAHKRMINFMLAFQTALAKKSKAKAEALKKKLLETAQDVSLNYRKHRQ